MARDGRDFLPLHHAVAGQAKRATLKELLDAYPGAAATGGPGGNVPDPRRHANRTPPRRGPTFHRRERGVRAASRRRGRHPAPGVVTRRGDTVARRGGAPSSVAASRIRAGRGGIPPHARRRRVQILLPYDSRAAPRESERARRRRRRGHDAAAPRRVAPGIRDRAPKSSSRTPPRRACRRPGSVCRCTSRRDTDPSTRFASSPTRIAQARERGTATGDSRCTSRWRRDGRRM